MEGDTIKWRYNYNALYTCYYYDQLCKLWAERMRDRATGSSKLWMRDKRKKRHLDKSLVIDPVILEYKKTIEETLDKALKLKLRRKIYYIQNKDRLLDNRKSSYWKNPEKKKQYQRQRTKLKRAA